LARNPKEYGLSHEDRVSEIKRKFGVSAVEDILGQLAEVKGATDQILGAIIFLIGPGHPEALPALIRLANEDPQKLLNAATVKDERG
jgi:hypothetical protein